MSDFGFFLMIAILLALFHGEPDLKDALVAHFMGQCPIIETPAP